MKKFFTSVALALALGTMSSNAENYNCPLTISMSGMDMPVGNIDVTVEQQSNGKYTLKLLNFDMAGQMPVGNIIVSDVEPTVCGNTIMLNAQKTIQIAAGEDRTDEDGYPVEWMGPSLGDVDILFKGQLKGNDFKALLNIPVAGSLIVGVKLGDNASNICQLPGSDFEEFHTATYDTATSSEPNGWHSFMSATGKLTSFVSSVTHTWESTDVRENAESGSTKCVKVASSSVLGQSANGTITTGRLNANNIFASNSSNCSSIDLSSTELDGNGDPFYAVLNNKPDSIKVWVKFHAGTKNKHPQASLSALLTNGQYVQDPEDKTYADNILARASKADIASTDEWQQVSVPFTYGENDETPKAALVTLSTCATPSGGSTSDTDPDVLYVDDVEMVYNASIKSIKFNGEDIADKFDEYGSWENEDYNKAISLDDFSVEADGAGAFVTKKITSDDDATYVVLTVTSNDLKNSEVRSITFTNVPTGVKAAAVTTTNGVQAIYNLAGQQVSQMATGKVYIVKTTDGKVKKMIKK